MNLCVSIFRLKKCHTCDANTIILHSELKGHMTDLHPPPPPTAGLWNPQFLESEDLTVMKRSGSEALVRGAVMSAERMSDDVCHQLTLVTNRPVLEGKKTQSGKDLLLFSHDGSQMEADEGYDTEVFFRRQKTDFRNQLWTDSSAAGPGSGVSGEAG